VEAGFPKRTFTREKAQFSALSKRQNLAHPIGWVER